MQILRSRIHRVGSKHKMGEVGRWLGENGLNSPFYARTRHQAPSSGALDASSWGTRESEGREDKTEIGINGIYGSRVRIPVQDPRINRPLSDCNFYPRLFCLSTLILDT